MKQKTILIIHLFVILTSCNQKNKFTRDELLVLNNKTSLNDNETLLSNIHKKLINSENDSINRDFLFKLANIYYEKGKPNKYFEIATQINKLATVKKDSQHIAKSFNCIGYYYNINTKPDSAFKYYLKAEKIYSALNDSLNSSKLKMYKAGILFDTGNFVESEIEAVEALKELTKINDQRLVYQCYVLIALSLKELNNYSKSLDYFDLALKQIEGIEKKKQQKDIGLMFRASCFNNIGRIYEKQLKYERAIFYYNKGLQIRNLKNLDPVVFAALLNNFAYSKMKLNRIKGIKNMLFNALEIRESINSTSGLISSNNSIGEYYILNKDTANALNYFQKSYVLSKKINSSQDILITLKKIINFDIKNKSYYTDEYFKISNSLQDAERITRNKFARIGYETDLIEEENHILSKKNSYILAISSIIILFSMGSLFLYRLKSKNNELLFIKEQQESNEKIYQLMLNQQSQKEMARNEERNRIAMELHDGIVNSIFTTRFNLIQLDPNQKDKKEQLVKELENAEKEVRRVSHDLQQNLLFEDKNLPDIITNLVESQHNEFNTKFDVSIDKYIDWSLISTQNKIHIYRIIQEAIQNINKYSNAEKCFIFLLKTANKTTLRIWDNGIGFNPKKVKQGIGLKNFKERAKALKGELKIVSSESNGTTIEIIF